MEKRRSPEKPENFYVDLSAKKIPKQPSHLSLVGQSMNDVEVEKKPSPPMTIKIPLNASDDSMYSNRSRRSATFERSLFNNEAGTNSNLDSPNSVSMVKKVKRKKAIDRHENRLKANRKRQGSDHLKDTSGKDNLKEIGQEFALRTSCHGVYNSFTRHSLFQRKTGRLPGVTNASHKLYDLFLINNFWRSRVQKKSLNNPDYDDLLNVTTEKLYSVAAPTAKDMLRFCSYNGRPFKCFNNFSQHVFAPHCFHFNNNKSHTLEATRLGPMAGLVVIMEESSQGLLFGNTFSAGAKVHFTLVGYFVESIKTVIFYVHSAK
ncbi:hypothetical protein PoB_007188300 [Plakobranchus ocellatus]|uniref:Uncharacterized protein n=1 Tax=Plakobranchus ocellatus TaxID=259542 RepID=A0AAV4DM28_9GAST|nr:hypothetical protein PoB_007188300 [Plakobranchus ocellatus]